MIEALLALMMGPVVAEIRLPAGTVVEPMHVAGKAEDVASLVGRETVRTIYPGKTIGVTDTKEADLVERNDLVRLVAIKGPLRIETRGRALGAGVVGTEIRVMNLESKRTIIGTIAGENLVEVEL